MSFNEMPINPILKGFYPDPSICRVGDDYYLVTSSFEYFPGIPVFRSRDLVNWRQIGHALTRPGQLPLQGAKNSHGIWAPTLRFHDGRFYLVSTNTTLGGNFLVTATDPAGPWSDPVMLDQDGIDPSLLFDGGRVYLTTSENRQSEIDPVTGRRLSDVRVIWPGTGGGYMEAPHLYRIGGWYYLIVAEGGTGRGHMVSIARSRDPWGPFTACPRNPILSNRGFAGQPLQCAGHGDLVEAHDGTWWMVFLGIREVPGLFPRVHTLGRETFIAPVTWDADGWPVVNQTGQASLKMPGPLLPRHPWPPAPLRENFDTAELGCDWVHLRNPATERYSLAARKGWLRLSGSSENLSDLASPTCLLRRQTAYHCAAATLLDFSPVAESDEAGLTVFMNNEHHYDACLVSRSGRRCVELRRRVGDLLVVAEQREIAPGPVELGFTADEECYHFHYTEASGRRTALGDARIRYLSTEVAGGFTGVMIGLYATGNGHVAQSPADFAWFSYRTGWHGTGAKPPLPSATTNRSRRPDILPEEVPVDMTRPTAKASGVAAEAADPISDATPVR